MKIAFFGLKNFLNYYQIGGIESCIRRIAGVLVKEGHDVDYLLYGGKAKKEIKIMPNFTLKYFTNFNDVLKVASNSYDHLIKIKLSKPDILRWISFSNSKNHSTRYHSMFLGWPELRIKQLLKKFEARLNSSKGKIICISPRVHRVFNNSLKNASFIYPPVPKDYFLPFDNKDLKNKIRITFLGMITPDKYIEEIIELFQSLVKNPRLEFKIYGTYDPKNQISAKIRNFLKEQKEISYFEVDRQSYSPMVEKKVIEVLKNTDIFVQPYRTLVNTVDTPLLLLEAMASLCAIITTPLGSIPEIYGKSEFLIPRENFLEKVKALLENITHEQILEERRRINKINKKLKFDEETIAKKFYKVLTKEVVYE